MISKLKINYLCPHCRSYLRVWNNIIFTVRSPDGGKRGLLLLNPELGKYDFISHYSLIIEEGEILDFYCPVCGENLKASDISEQMAWVVMTDEEGKEYDVYFSRICGEHSTFKIKEDDIIEKYGKDISSYMNYFVSKLKKYKE